MIPKELTERFHHSQVRKNQSNQDYVSIDGYINRLNSVIDNRWNWEVHEIQFRDGPETRSGKPQYIAIASGTLSITLNDDPTMYSVIRRDGVGAGLNFDPDTAVKTAQAEALKKACHQYGIALYLWSEDERNYVELQRQAATDDIALKRLVMEYVNNTLALDPDETPQRDDIVKCLGIEDLSVENMRAVLVEKGVL